MDYLLANEDETDTIYGKAQAYAPSDRQESQQKRQQQQHAVQQVPHNLNLLQLTANKVD